MTSTQTPVTTQVYRVWIKATPEAIWDAITKPEWTDRYGYGGRGNYDLRPGRPYQVVPSEAMKKAGAEMGFSIPDVVVDGEVIEADPPRKLVLSWRMLMDEAIAAEGFTRLTYDIEAGEGGVTKVTVSHDVEGAPKIAAMIDGAGAAEGGGGGWAWVLSDLKTLLETGKSFEETRTGS